MTSLRELTARLLGLFRKQRGDADLNEELGEHINLLAEENIRRGMSGDAARSAARRDFGAIELIKESYRDRRGLPMLEGFGRDLRYGARMLRKNPGFTVVAVLTLALGIGANTAIFSVVNGILIEPLVYTGSSRLVMIGEVSLSEIREIREQSTAFERMSIYQRFGGLILGGGAPMRFIGSRVSADFFPMLGVKPMLGRPILAEDTQTGGDRVTVLSYSLWMDIFGGDPGIVGRGIVMNEKPYTVVGVMPKEFELGVAGGGWEPGVWTPLAPLSQKETANPWRRYDIVARLGDGISLTEANAQLKTLSTRLAAEFPKTEQGNQLEAISVKDLIVSKVRIGLLILLGAVGFVLLIACVNVSALLVARAWARQKEVAIRRALGATRMRIVRQLLTESALLAIAGGALGLLFSAWGIRVLRKIAPPNTPRLDHLRLNGNVLWFALGISLLAAILFGLAPALQGSSRRMGGELKKGLSGTLAGFVGRHRRRMRGALVIVESALAVILVIGSALMVRSFQKLINLDTGVRTDHVIMMLVAFDSSPYLNSPVEKWPPVISEVLDRIRSLEGVQRAAVGDGFALQGGANIGNGRLYVEGMQGDQDPYGSPLLDRPVTPGYFDALGIRLLSGRDFEDTDCLKNSRRVAIVSQGFAHAYIPGDPVGKRFSTWDDDKGNHQWMEIVGMVNDTRDRSLKEMPGLVYYMPEHPISGWGTFLARTSFDPMAMAAAVRQQVWAVDKNATILRLETLDQVIAESAAEPKFQAVRLGSFGVLGLFLAAIGIYGLISYSVAQRTHEIGVRMALGAQPRDVMRLVIRQGAGLALAGIAFGLAGAWALTRVLRNLLYDIKPTDPTTFAGVAILLFVVALLACFIPARRATRVDPLVALRYE